MINCESIGVSEMNAFYNRPASEQVLRLQALDRWHRALENRELRMDCPDAYHDELLRLSDEMDRQAMLTLAEWRDLRKAADVAYLRAVAGGDYH